MGLACTALNEGRSQDPGDTSFPTRRELTASSAQRRPEPRPRRHCSATGSVSRHGIRSTKAGAKTPATLYAFYEHHGLVVRSTKAGAKTPATPSLQETKQQTTLRSTKAGAKTPATPRGRERTPRESDALNEGRSQDPGDTHRRHNSHCGRKRRSTKAGAKTPATPVVYSPRLPFCKCAQRRPEPRPRRHITQAPDGSGRLATLNEGRSQDPGDTG